MDSIQPLTFDEVVREVNARESAREFEAKVCAEFVLGSDLVVHTFMYIYKLK